MMNYKKLKKNKIFLIFLLLSIFSILPVNAKRVAPKEVAPIVYKGVKYVVPHFKFINKEAKHGYIEAWDLKTNKKLWELQVYNTIYNPNLEKDVQDVFITSIKIKDNDIIIENEKKETYKLNIKTKKIIKI